MTLPPTSPFRMLHVHLPLGWLKGRAVGQGLLASSPTSARNSIASAFEGSLPLDMEVPFLASLLPL